MVHSMQGKRPEYFEATLQLREITNEVEEYVRTELKKSGVHIAKEKPLPNGFDFYLSDSDFTQNLGRRLQDKFGGEYVVSPKLFSHKDGRSIYRLTILFRGLPCKKGDKIMYRGEEYIVLVVSKELTLQHTQTNKKLHLKQKDFHYLKVIS